MDQQHQSQRFNRFRYKTRVQAVAVIDIIVGTIPFVKLGYAFNDQSLADTQDREYLVLAWMTLMVVYVMQLIMAVWLLAATRDCNADLAVGNCSIWMYTGMFLLGFYILELMFKISTILNAPSPDIKNVILILAFYGAKIIYRVTSLMAVNNFIVDISRPTYTSFVPQGNYLIPYYDIPLRPITYPTFPQPKTNNYYQYSQRYPYRYQQNHNHNYYPHHYQHQ